MAKPQVKSKGKAKAAKPSKSKRVITQGVAHIAASFNNTIITITDRQGNPLCWSSPPRLGNKGARKSMPFAGGKAAEHAAGQARDGFGMKEVDVKVKGPGMAREMAIKGLQAAGLKILSIEDVTGIPHNGCRSKKRRRV
ncbi:MAG: 30S ribosomal protein S11 [Gammaproteobacteria bacterium]